MTANAQQPLPFTPCTGQHSVKEASVGIFVSDKISAEEYAAYVRSNAYLSETFPDFRTIYKRGDEYSVGGEPDSAQPQTVAGFTIGHLAQENDPVRYFQAFNEDNRQYFSLHERNYVRWAPFKDMFIKTVRSLQDLDSDLKVEGISLTYVDEYHWQSGQPIDYNEIFVKGNKYLPSVFFEEGTTAAQLSTTLFLTKGSFDFHVRLSIQPVIEEEKQVLRIIHNAVNTDVKWGLNYLTSDENGELPILIQEAHELNKDILKSILLPQVIDLINMK